MNKHVTKLLTSRVQRKVDSYVINTTLRVIDDKLRRPSKLRFEQGVYWALWRIITAGPRWCIRMSYEQAQRK